MIEAIELLLITAIIVLIFRSLIFRLGDYVFGIQLNNIKKVVSIKNIKDFSKVKTYSYKGIKYKILHIQNKVGLKNLKLLAKHMVLLNNKLCIPILGKIDENEMVIKKMSNIFYNIKYIKGTAVNSVGQIVFILDINKL